jgi:hypothetical protein
MTTSRRTIARPLRSSTVRCPSGPTLTKAVDKVRRPWASAGESARRAEAGFSAADTGSGSDPWAACARSPAPPPVGLGAAEPWPSAFVSRDSRAAVSGTGLGLRIVASLGGGLQATSAAMQGGKRQGIAPFASLNTAFATRTAPSSHRTRGVCVGREREDAEAAIATQACVGDRSDLAVTAGTHRTYFVKFQWGYQ